MIELIVCEQKDIDAVRDYLSNTCEGKTLSVKISEYCHNRSKAQNALSHVWYSQISKKYYETHGELYSPNVWKEYLKKMILGEEAIEGPRGTVIRTIRTRDLKVKYMSEYMEQVVIYCATEFDIVLTGLEGV